MVVRTFIMFSNGAPALDAATAFSLHFGRHWRDATEACVLKSVIRRVALNDVTRMQKTSPAASPDAYVAALHGWRRKCVKALRTTVLAASKLEEVIKWRNLVYFANGPVLVIRAEDARVLFGFWRGQRLRNIEPALKPGGKYEMATLELREGMTVNPAIVRRLTRMAVKLNATLGDPTLAAAQRSSRRKRGKSGQVTAR
jgi:hypothetical protein